MLKACLLLTSLLLTAQSLFGFVLEGQKWTLNRTVQVQLSLGPERHLSDGFASFNDSAADVLNIWNTHLAHLQFLPVRRSPVIPAGGDDELSATFSATIFGENFGSGVLAVTLLNDRNGTFEETDTLFNSFYHWDSYNGPLRAGGPDFHRVALHEFGHTLGLDHPDENGQHVAAIMNSTISNRFTLTNDDIAGVQSLYADGPAEQFAVDAPVLANLSTRGLVGTGENVVIGGFIIQGSQPATVILRAIGFSLSSHHVLGPLSDPFLQVFDANKTQIAKSDDWFVESSAETIASYHLDPPNSRESALILTLQPGEYTASISGFVTPGQPSEGGVGLFELFDLHTTGGRAGNISTRGEVLSGDNVLIGGFIIGGAETKPVVVRALGPSLGSAGVANPLSDPTLELRDVNGDLIEANDDWQKGPDAAAIAAAGFAPSKAKESALSATLNPGSYTVIVTGVKGATGIGLVEIYDLSKIPSS